MYSPNVQQAAFRESLKTDELKANFDVVVSYANDSADVAGMVAKLPAAYAPIVAGAATLEALVDKVLEVSNWGDGINYRVAKTVAPPKAKAKAAKTVAPPPAAGEPVATKRRGNPEALKKAREARGGKTPEMTAKDRATVIAATVEYLKANTNATTPVIHIKTICADLTKSLATSGSDGKDLKEIFIYTTITDIAKDVAITPFVKTEMEGHKCGYQLKK